MRYFCFNYRERDSDAGAVADAIRKSGGMAASRSLDDITEEDFNRTLVVNLKS
jgi:hypothetical protein